MDGAEKPKRRPRVRRGSGELTVADVARQAGVSPMTVSRVINRLGNVLPETRARVEAAIAALDFVPNPAARSLAGRPQCRIALLHSNPSAAYLSEFLVGSLAGAAETDAQLVVEHWDGRDSPTRLAQRLTDHRIDAVLLPPPLCDDAALLAALSASKLPLAQIATGAPVAFADAVSIDDEGAAHAMTRHLLALGHRRIGFIAGDPNQTASALRQTGYARALRDAGLDVDDELIVQGDFTYRSGLDASERLLSQMPRPTAIFASNDDMAAAVIALAHRHRLDVPHDLTVCGFDDTAMARAVWPEITTIRQPVADMAHRAMLRLADRVRAGASPDAPAPLHEELAFTLVERASDARPASA